MKLDRIVDIIDEGIELYNFSRYIDLVEGELDSKKIQVFLKRKMDHHE